MSYLPHSFLFPADPKPTPVNCVDYPERRGHLAGKFHVITEDSTWANLWVSVAPNRAKEAVEKLTGDEVTAKH